MGMFETTGRREAGAERKENTLRKLERMKTALSHREPVSKRYTSMLAVDGIS